MRHVRSLLFLAFVCLFAVQAEAAEARLIKVLPQFLDKKGRHTLNPSLYERDAYQKTLREMPNLRGALRFAVQHSSPKKDQNLKVRAELRGVNGQDLTSVTLEAPAIREGMFRSWTMLQLEGKEFRNFGELSAWRVTLWEGDKKVGEHKSFLW